MSNKKNNRSNDDDSSERVIDSFIRRAMDEGDIDPDDFDSRPKNVFWDKTTIRAALGGLAVLILVNLFFYYNMRVEQVDNTSDWVPERRGYLVEYREGRSSASGNESTPSSSTSSEVVTQPQENSRAVAPQENTVEEEVAPESRVQENPARDIPQQIDPAEEVSDSAAVTNSRETSVSRSPISTDPNLSPRDQVRATVGSWAQAWTFKNVDRYLAHYSRNFISQGGAPFEPWAELRYERIESPEWIHVSVDQLRVSINEQSAVAEFTQVYSSPDFSSESRKTLVLEKEDGGWKIIRETVQPQ